MICKLVKYDIVIDLSACYNRKKVSVQIRRILSVMEILAFDIGGTNIKYGRASLGKIHLTEKGCVPSDADKGVDIMLQNVERIIQRQKFDALCFATAGMVDRDGTIFYANDNIPGYTGCRLKEIFEQKYSVPVCVINDIAAAAIAEKCGEDDYYFLSLGTGVGGIYVSNGALMTGSSFMAGQIGYLPSYGRQNEIDKTASVRALEKNAGINAAELFRLFRSGNESAKEKLKAWSREVVYVLSLIVGFINPPKIILGGGISVQGNCLLEVIGAEMRVMPIAYRNSFTLQTAKYFNDSGVIGALKFMTEQMK
mgnify:CR=1 FL=1